LSQPTNRVTREHRPAARPPENPGGNVSEATGAAGGGPAGADVHVVELAFTGAARTDFLDRVKDLQRILRTDNIAETVHQAVIRTHQECIRAAPPAAAGPRNAADLKIRMQTVLVQRRMRKSTIRRRNGI
jgi:hypothetical protein